MRTTSAPSRWRFSATTRMRLSLSSTRNPLGADRLGLGSPAVLDAQVVEEPQRLPGEVAELGVVALALQLADDD